MRKQDLHPRTAVLNKEQKNHSKTLRITALQWLAIHFPLAFDNSSCIRPLKIGIMEDILVHADKAAEVGISKSKLREALVLFTRRLDYLTCLKIRERRIDLQGHEVTEVTLEEAEHAAVKIKKRVEKSARNARKQSVTKVPSAHAHHAVNTAYSKATNQVIQEPADYLPT
jgi:ProP effector